ncbi:cation:proton antiporter domain-containing protein [Falsiroseomonas tokyonensis]|uniref:Cation:proton antiporter n=1 Tax=Falsiroseomonas tokyonensis TaxID=430521 RepID=A0ABV7BPQ3_9PROT|nr:cation:proton antiporter [Falsiroseomonas tokyonensis]MBU8536602.1 cation:proton antiporter [Falsiroseomonas tokyonensis]
MTAGVLSFLDIVALLLVLSAGFGWLNQRFLGLPGSIGLLSMGLVSSLLLVVVDMLETDEPLNRSLIAAVGAIDFQSAVLDGLLAFLLFAGALHLDISRLRGRAWPVALMATGGTLLSTFVIGLGLGMASAPLGYPLPLPWALVFGGLISRTDPVAVLGTLKVVQVPASIETDMSGESLFNDGVGVVLFALLVILAAGGEA